MEQWSRTRRRLLLPHTRAGATLGAGALLVVRESGHAAGVIALGVIQQRALDGRRGSFHAMAMVRADDRFGTRV
jgi:hypothetical protein